MKRTYYIIMTALILALTGCEKDPATLPDTPDENSSTIAWVLNEGLWGANDGSLTRLDYQTGSVENSYFAKMNGRGLGDVAQDIATYGSKLWIVVYGSSTLEVADRRTAESIRQISFAGKSPRYIAFSDGKAYVSCYNKYIYAIDTATLTIIDSCRLSGLQPEAMAVAGGYLYVVNSWEYDASGNAVYDSTISVVNLGSFTETEKIAVGLNPYKVAAIDDQHLLIGYTGDYVSTNGGLVILDLGTRTLTPLGIEASGFDIYDHQVYSYSYSYTTGNAEYHRTDLQTLQTTTLPIGTGIKCTYGIRVNPKNGQILLTDSQQFRSNGDVRCYSPDGTELWHAETGKGPSKIIFL